MVGVSIFPGMDVSLNENIEYLRRCKKKGINLIFTSMHIPEVAEERLIFEFSQIMEECKKLEMKVIVDISKKYYTKYNWESYNIFALRLDFGFSDSEIVEISNRFPIQLNASTIDIEWFERLESLGLNKKKLTVCHNYYPRKDTGISLSLLKERNDFFKKIGFSTMGFVPGGKIKRGPLYEGLPTCETHRDKNILLSAQELIHYGTDFVIIGDSMGTDEEVKALSQIEKDVITIPIEVLDIPEEIINILKREHSNRLDAAENVIRFDRLKNSWKLDVALYNNVERKIGDITIDNKSYLRYEGEIQISLKNLPKDERVNVIGRVKEVKILQFVTPGKKIKLLF